MEKIILVARRELLENMRTKGFWIGIFIFPIMLAVMMVVPALLDKAKSARHYTVVDNSGWLLEEFQQQTRVGDLVVAFQSVAEKHEDNDTAELPQLLIDLAPDLALMDAGEIGRAATMIARPTLVGDAPVSDVIQRVVSRGPALLEWLGSISSKDARNVSSRLSVASYRLVPRDGKTEDELSQMILNDELFAYIVVTDDPISGTEVSRYVSNNLTDDDLQNWFRRAATSLVREKRLLQEEISPTVAAWIQQPFVFEAEKIGDSGAVEEVNDIDTIRQWAPVAFLYLLWISVFMSSQMLLTNTIEEKSNRIIEVLLSSVSPLQLMVGKISGIAASGLILVGSWMTMFYFGTKYIPSMLGAPASFDLSVLASDPTYVVSFIVYYLLGYLLYASLLVAIGSVVNTIKEAQNLMQPITLFLVAPLIAMIPIGKDPNGMLAKVMSYIPPFTPFVMMNRAAAPPTTFEYVTTSIVLLVSVGIAMWAAAKIFRIGVLLTGKPPSVREIFRWVKAPVGAVPDRGE